MMATALQQTDLVFSHMGLYVRDLIRMAKFYSEVMCFTITDRGNLDTPTGAVQFVFLSRDPSEHHQIILASGKPETATYNNINQISLRVPSIAMLRAMRDRVAADKDVSDLVCATHGNAISIYFRDPEGNRLEVFWDTPWHCEQPLREPIDLDQSDEAVQSQAETLARSRPNFQSRIQWQAEMSRRMGYTV
jgi:catechol 2,3-dioxygenase